LTGQDERNEGSGSGEPSPPELIAGRYEARSRLGAGAFGEVIRAHDHTLDRDVALKRIRLELFAEPGQLEEVQQRFQREARVAARLRHPNIVTTHDILTDASGSYIVMEMVEGRTLQSALLDRGALGLEETAGILAQVAAALDHAHEHGVVHRDVKPANVMIEPSGHVKVMDFGVAKVESGANLTSSGLILGTPNYIAPEQARGDKVDGRADLFSLGCILYECLSGQKPFHAETVAAILIKILTEEPPTVDAARRGLPPAVADVVRRAMAKAPERRYPRGADLIAALCAAADLPPPTLLPVAATAAAAGPDVDGELELDEPEEAGERTAVSAAPPRPRPATGATGRWRSPRISLVAALAVVAVTAILLTAAPLWRALAPSAPSATEGAPLVQREDVGFFGKLLGLKPRLVITVPAESSVRLALSSPLTSETAAEGDAFDAVVADPVVVEGTEAIPAGTRARGHVAGARSAGRTSERAELTLELDRLSLEDGQTLYVRSKPLLVRARSGARRDAGVAGTLAEIRSAVGGFFGGKKGAGTPAPTRGEQVELSPGASLVFDLGEAVRVTRPVGES
jgi:tRNA A-37 threonylcarbamoyl transferase component Bud32